MNAACSAIRIPYIAVSKTCHAHDALGALMGGTVVAHGPGIQLRPCSYPYTYTRPVPRMDGVGFPPLQAALYEA